MQTITVKFQKSMKPDPNDSSGAQLIKHFDNWTREQGLIPFRDSEDAYVGQSTFHGQNFTMDSGNMYMLGEASSKASILKNTTIDVPSWSTPTNGTDPTNNVEYGFFEAYLGTLWGSNTQGFWSYAGTTFTTNASTFTKTSISNGLIHKKDSVLYVGYSNTAANQSYIARKNGSGAWELTALTIPTSTHKIVSICEYQNYVAIGFAPYYIGGKSFVLLWDRNTSVLDVTDYIDVGSNILYTLEEIEGYLIAVSLTGNTSANLQAKMICSRYSVGAAFHPFEEILLASGANSIVGKQKENNRLYFGLNASSYTNPAVAATYDYTGIWSIGRKSESEEFSVVMSQLPNNDTAVQAIKGFILVQDYFYISYLDGSGNYGLSKTNDQASYTATSVYLTSVNPGNMSETDKYKSKTVKALAVTYDPLPGTSSSRQISVRYRVDNSAFVTALIKTDDSVVGTKVITETGKDTNGNAFEHGRDLEFEIDSKGVIVTGLIYCIETDISLINPKI